MVAACGSKACKTPSTAPKPPPPPLSASPPPPPPPRAAPWNWSDQYDLKLQIAGVNGGYDREVIRGDPASRAFAAFYFAGGKLLGCDAVNAPAEFVSARQIIARGLTLDPNAVPDT